MFIKETAGISLGELNSMLNQGEMVWEGDVSDLEVDIANTPTPVLKLKNGPEVPLQGNGSDSLASFLGIPVKYYNRIDNELRQANLEHWLAMTPGQVVISYVPNQGVLSVDNPKKLVLAPHELTETLLEVFPSDSTVVDWEVTAENLMLDVLFGNGNSEEYQGGNVGDVTRAGLRVGQNRKVQGKPWISRYLYRLVCTNGLEIQDSALRLTGRGNKPESILGSFKAFAEAALEPLERDIRSFYALQDQEVQGDTSVAVLRMAEERGLSDRMTRRLIGELVANPVRTEFDLVNLVTNMANSPDLEEHRAQRRTLELVGGSLVTEHTKRCTECMRSM